MPARAKGANVKLLLQKKSSAVSREQNRFLMGPVCRPETPPVRGRLPAKVWVELALGLTSSALLALAFLSPHWMELLLYTSDAADEEDSVDLGGRRIIK